MIPVFRQEIEGEILRQFVEADGPRIRLETTDQQTADIVAEIEMRVMIAEGRQVSRHLFHRLGQQIEMFAGMQRRGDSGKGRDRMAP